MKNQKELISYYNSIKFDIQVRLLEFAELWYKASEKDLFAELCFCLCTPQSKAKLADKAIRRLIKNNTLFSGTIDEIREKMSGVRFPNNKSKYIFEARNIFKDNNNKVVVRKFIDNQNIKQTRDWLTQNVKGLGYKESSHFLRNIGLGKNLAILDKHILKNMLNFNIIDEIPKTLTKKIYFEFENKLERFVDKINISMQELDLVFWSSQTGEIFK